jgi:hypothetical protein
MDVKKIFMTLVAVVACIIIGAFILNVFVPNAVKQAVNAVESAVFSATGISFDLNGDGVAGADGNGSDATGGADAVTDGDRAVNGNNVGGYNGFTGQSSSS